MPLRIIEAADPQDLADYATNIVLSRIERGLSDRGRASVILTGGRTPRITYALLAEEILRLGLPTDRISWFMGDERWVTVEDPESNEGMARATLLTPLGAPESTIHSWHAGVGDPVACAAAYGAEAARLLGGPENAPDVLLLGMGADGHTASLFPGATAHLADGRRLPVSSALPGTAAAISPAAGPPPANRGWRLTLCPDFLRTSRYVVFFVTGAEKAAAFRRATRGDSSTPAAWIRGEETLFFATRDVFGDRDQGIRLA